MIRSNVTKCSNQICGQKRKISIADAGSIKRYCKVNPFASDRSIRDELNFSVISETIRSGLAHNKSFVRSPRKVPLVNKKHMEAHIQFAKEHVTWPVAKSRNICLVRRIKNLNI